MNGLIRKQGADVKKRYEYVCMLVFVFVSVVICVNPLLG